MLLSLHPESILFQPEGQLNLQPFFWAAEITEVIGHDGVDVLEYDITHGHKPTEPAAKVLKFPMVTLEISGFYDLIDEDLAIYLYEAESCRSLGSSRLS